MRYLNINSFFHPSCTGEVPWDFSPSPLFIAAKVGEVDSPLPLQKGREGRRWKLIDFLAPLLHPPFRSPPKEEKVKGQTGKFDKSRKSLPFLHRVFLFPQGHIHSSRMSEKKRGGGEGDPLSAKNLPPLLTCPQLYLSNGIRQFFLAWS